MAIFGFSFVTVFYAVTAASIALAAYIYYILIIRPKFSPLDQFPGPDPSHPLFGNLLEIHRGETGEVHDLWVKKYGKVIAYRGFGGEHRINFTDPRALNHILITNVYSYPKPETTRGEIRRLLGQGVLFAEGEDHRRARKILQPSFSATRVAELVPAMQAISEKLREQWVHVVGDAVKASGEKQNYAIIDVGIWMSKTTLDIIGKAGFDYDFNSLENEENELAKVFAGLTKMGAFRGRVIDVLIFFLARTKFFFWILRSFRNERVKAMERSMEVMERESKKLLDAKKASVAAEARGEHVDAGQLEGKDLMSQLVKANNSEDAKSRLSDVEVMGQMTTFILAGHETTGTALTWLLWQLALQPSVQSRLREEVQAAKAAANAGGHTDIPFDDLNALPYLEAVTREALRFHPPVPGTLREAQVADQIPVSEPIKLRNGRFTETIPVRPGDKFFIPIHSFNRSESIWGADANEFRPERWLNKEAAGGGAGVYAGIMTFLAGPRGCIGYRFALAEFKVILATIIANFAFATRDEDGGPAIEKTSAIVMKPRIKGQTDKGTTMPLRVSMVADSHL